MCIRVGRCHPAEYKREVLVHTHPPTRPSVFVLRAGGTQYAQFSAGVALARASHVYAPRQISLIHSAARNDSAA